MVLVGLECLKISSMTHQIHALQPDSNLSLDNPAIPMHKFSPTIQIPSYLDANQKLHQQQFQPSKPWSTQSKIFRWNIPLQFCQEAFQGDCQERNQVKSKLQSESKTSYGGHRFGTWWRRNLSPWISIPRLIAAPQLLLQRGPQIPRVVATAQVGVKVILPRSIYRRGAVILRTTL